MPIIYDNKKMVCDKCSKETTWEDGATMDLKGYILCKKCHPKTIQGTRQSGSYEDERDK